MPEQKPASIQLKGEVGGDVVAGDQHTGAEGIRGGKTTTTRRWFARRKKLDQRDRRILLDKVHNFWVEGVLEKSLHGEAMIALGMREQPGAVDHPWDRVVGTSEQEKTYILPSGIRIVEVFDRLDHALLILGEPGSGKTTTLLELARDLVARARDHTDEPVPVVFNLSSWVGKEPIDKWLARELNARYGIPRRIVRKWIAEEWLLLLLDGLDEVREEYREACVTAINAFRGVYSLTPLVVCSRTDEYRVLTAQLKLRGAVTLQPLNREQIAAYLDRPGDALLAVRTLFHSDETLLELVQTPLLLNMMVLAYGGASLVDLPQGDTVEVRHKHLFNAYLKRMLLRKKGEASYTPEQIVRWLVWLARKMVDHAQPVFLIERMQPDWFDKNGQRRIYRAITVLVCVLIFGLLGRLLGVLICGLVVGLLGGLIFGWGGEIKTVEAWGWSWRRALNRLLFIGLPGVLIFWLISGLLGLILGALAWILVVLWDSLMVLTIIGYFIGWVDPNTVMESVATDVAEAGLFIGPMVAPLVGLFGGLGRKQVRARSMVVNQGIWQSANRTLVAGLLGGLVAGLAAGLDAGQNAEVGKALLGGLADRLDAGLATGLVAGLLAGLVGVLLAMLLHGGKAIIQHFTLRVILARSGCLPWKLVPFLDHATDLIILRKVGGGYIFVHRLLMEHFAAMSS